MDSPAPVPGDLQPGPFISYSRSDQEFVRRLHDSLHRRGRDTWVDWQGILPTEEWMAKIRAAIDAAQAFVFVISPDSTASKVCREEIEHAVAHNKRLIPVVARDVDAAAPHEALRALNWIYIRAADDFEQKVDQLIAAMDMDLDWIRDQSRLLVRAGEWEKRQREASVLLRGRDLADAERWLLSCGRAPNRQATPLQVEYIVASRQQESRRRTVVLAATTLALLIAVGLGILAWIQRNAAQFEARVALAKQLAAQSEMVRGQRADMLPRSLLLGIEAMALAPEPALEADQAVRHAWERMPRVVARLPHAGPVVDVAYNGDGTRVATLTGEGVGKVWNAETGAQVGKEFKLENGGAAIAFLSPGASRVVTAGRQSLQVWDAATGEPRGPALAAPSGTVMNIVASSDGRYFAAPGRSIELRVWDLETMDAGPAATIRFKEAGGGIIDTAAAFSPDGKYFAGTRRGSLKVFEVANWQQPAAEVALPAGGPVLPVAFSHDGRLLAVRLGTTVELRRVPQWDTVVATLESSGMVAGPEWRVALAFSADDRYLAAGIGEDSVTVWEIESGKVAATIRQEGRLSALRFSPGAAAVLATAGADGTARIRDLAENRELARISHRAAVGTLAFSPDGAHLATAGADGLALISDASGESDVAQIRAEKGIARTWFSPARECLWAASGFALREDGSLAWRCRDGVVPRAGRMPEEGALSSFALTADGRFVAGAQGEAAMVWDTETRTLLARLEHTAPLDWEAIRLAQKQNTGSFNKVDRDIERMQAVGSVRIEALSDDGRYVATSRADDVLRVWSVQEKKEVMHEPFRGVQVALSPRGGYAAMTTATRRNIIRTGDETDAVRVWPLARPADLIALRHARAVESMAFGSDESMLVTVDAGNIGRLWDLKTGREKMSFPHAGNVPPELSPDGRFLAARPDNERVQLWDTATRKPVGALLPVVPAGDPAAFAWSRDSRRLAFGTAAGAVYVVALPAGEVVAELNHAGPITALAFSADGKHLASGSGDATVRVLDIAANHEIARVAHGGPVADARFGAGANARYLATASGANALAVLWMPGDLQAEACRRVPYGLDDDVWRRYLGATRPVGCAPEPAARARE